MRCHIGTDIEEAVTCSYLLHECDGDSNSQTV